MRLSSILLSCAALTAPSLASAQAPAAAPAPAPAPEVPASDEAAPAPGGLGVRVAPRLEASQNGSQPGALAQVPPPPPGAPGAAPWPVQGPPQQQVVLQAPPQGYVYAQPVMYGPQVVYAPPLQPYEGGPVPPGMTVRSRARTGLISAGSAIFGVPWITSLIVATASNRDSDSNGLGWLAVPAIGPIIAGAVNGASTTGWTVLMLDALLQSGGLAMFLYGITHPAQYLVPTGPQARVARPRLRWAVAPGTGAGPGATFSLTF
ncbi:MAG: hypothetical protein R3A48_16340 [Polyangiales bacterium]